MGDHYSISDIGAGSAIGPGAYVNIARDHAVVGQQISREPAGVQVYAWIKDNRGVLWILVSRHSEGGVYSSGTAQDSPTTTIHGINVSDIRTAVLGPVVWIK
jgi:hypothetical protein